MHKKIVFFLLLSLAITPAAFSQTNKSVVKDIRKIDTLLQPIPIKRQLFHTQIDDELVKVDYLDGKYDNKIENFRGEKIDGIIHNDILRRGKALANYV